MCNTYNTQGSWETKGEEQARKSPCGSFLCSESVFLSTAESFGHLNEVSVPKSLYLKYGVLLVLHGNLSDYLTRTPLL